MGRPRNADGTETRERILRAAEAEFGAVGFDRARLEDIAQRAGIRRPSLLYHFESKAGLYAAVVRGVNEELGALLASAAAGNGLDGVIDALMSFGTKRRAALAMFVRELLDAAPGGGAHVRELVPLVDALVDLVRAHAGSALPPAVPLRGAVLALLTSQALRLAAGKLGGRIWGDDDPRDLVRALLTPPTRGAS